MKQKINSVQYCSMFILIVFSTFQGAGFFALVKATGIDAYFSVIIAAILGLPLLLIFFRLFDYEPDLPLPKKVEKLCGKKIGFVINLIFAVVVFLLGVNLFFNLMNFIVSQFLPETPTFFVGFMFLLVIGYSNRKGIEAMSRTSLLLLVIVLILFLLTSYGLYPTFDIQNLKPVLEYGIGRPLFGSLYVLTLNLSPFLMLLLIPKNQLTDPQKVKKRMIVSYFFVLILLFFVVFATLGNLGIYLASIYQYPEYIVLKRINIFNFLDRIENVVTSQWIFALVVSLNFVVYFVSNVFKYQNKSKTLPYLLPFFMLLCAHYFFTSNTAFNNFTYHVPPLVRAFSVSLCFILAILTFFHKSKKSSSKK